ncbi:DNA ligase 1-like [Ruditapes philippinarum]|uniref:DNA ligase 1-like n=1 Tax=Ruditapes philippinarum TaxID=129788 RepID=UPI00295C33B2|nr:DNA ligase 1-like [Ruditapes philippinarum]
MPVESTTTATTVVTAALTPPTSAGKLSPSDIVNESVLDAIPTASTDLVTTPSKPSTVVSLSVEPTDTSTASMSTVTPNITTDFVTTPSKSSDECVSKATDESISPFSKHLIFPKTETKKPKARKMIMPKAITGEKYRQWLKEKEEKKEKELKEKQQRQRERLQKKLKRAKELKEKQIALEKKRKDREEAKKKLKELKEKKKQENEQIIKEIEASDSDDNIAVSPTSCFKCETPYEDYIQCSNCFRRFHLTCVADELTDCPDDLPFECKYC